MRLRVRLEDFSKDGDPASEAKPFSERLRSTERSLAATRKALAEANSPGNQDRALVAKLRAQLNRERAAKKRLTTSQTTARSTSTALADEFSIDIYTVPTDLTVDMNSFRMADKCHASFPFIDAPLISDIIRAALVEVWIGTVTPEDFAAPDRWRLRRDRAKIVFRGYVDTWETTHDDQDAQVQIEARSLEAILIDAKINPLAKAYRIGGEGEKISKYINRILGEFPPTSGVSGGDSLKSAWYGALGSEEPLLDRKALMRSLQTAKSRTEANAGDPVQADPVEGGTPPEQTTGAAPASENRMPPKSPGQEMSLWDLITQACTLAGCIPTYDPSLAPRPGVKDPGDFILLRPPQTIYGDVSGGHKIKGGAVDGFSRVFRLPGGQITSEIRFLVWGHNIKGFKTSRKLGRIKVPGVEVISYNSDGPPDGRRMSVLYPPDARTTRIGPKGEGQLTEIKTIQVNGIRDKAQLMQAAVGLYHSLSRQELSVNIETNDMSSYIDPGTDLSHNDEMDMLRLRPGSPCRVVVAREVKDPAAGQTLVISPLSEVFEKRGAQLLETFIRQQERFRPSSFKLPGENTSSVFQMVERISKALASGKITDVFYCRAINHKFSSEDGWSATMELVNFLEARNLPANLSPDTKAINEKRMVKTPASKRAKKR